MVQGGDFSEGKTLILTKQNQIFFFYKFIFFFILMYIDLKVRQVSGSTGPIFFSAHLII